jgi:hypothetical protein
MIPAVEDPVFQSSVHNPRFVIPESWRLKNGMNNAHG